MLSKVRCPHTGVVNFFSQTDPMISVGSIVVRAPGEFVWRCHIADSVGGTVWDPARAEANLRSVLEHCAQP